IRHMCITKCFFNGAVRCSPKFISSFNAIVSWDRTRLRKGTTAETQTLCTMPRRQGPPHIGTFACRTFKRDTKASKRANLCHTHFG
ncbi:MAG: hypothetical protein ACK5SJ_07400, partial [Bacteroidota bacterium]